MIKPLVLSLLFALGRAQEANTITAINGLDTASETGASNNDCYPSQLVDEIVATTGFVSAVKSGDGYYIQQTVDGLNEMQTPAYGSGIYVYDSTSVLAVSVGDEVQIVGKVAEYYGLTEIVDVTETTVLSSSNVLVPLTITTGQLGTACNADGEKLEGMLVKVFNALVMGAPNSYGEIAINDGTGDTQLEDGLVDHSVGDVPSGTVLTSVTGVVHYAFGSYEIHPRTTEDLDYQRALSPPSSPSPLDTATPSTSPMPLGSLFISEYAEGSSNNKYLEIYNAGTETVDLSGYAYPSVSNAPDTPGEHEYWNTFDAGATIAPGAVYVICHPSADAEILAKCDEEHPYLSNGDDGYCLVQGTEDAYIMIDCVGDFNGDPGSGWDVCGEAGATKDKTLVRKSSVMNGNYGDWTASAGTTADDCEWHVKDTDDWSNLGFYQMGETSPSPSPSPPIPSSTTSPSPMPLGSLFISEYAEGSSNNKYLEIYNAGTETVDLSGYAYPSVSNAPDTPGEHEYWNTFDAGATIAPGAVYVICHPSADAEILAKCDEMHQYLSNGDDGYCLVQGTEDAYVMIDCVGDFNGDPGSGWDVCGEASATKDKTLVRKSSVMYGNYGDWTASAGTTADDCEWHVKDTDDWAALGYHDMELPMSPPPPPEPVHCPPGCMEPGRRRRRLLFGALPVDCPPPCVPM